MIAVNAIVDEFPELTDRFNSDHLQWIAEYERLNYEYRGYTVSTTGWLRREVRSHTRSDQKVFLMMKLQPKPPTKPERKLTVGERMLRDQLRKRRRRSHGRR